MVVAFLQGLLPDRNNHGLRSILSENVILEAIDIQNKLTDNDTHMRLSASVVTGLVARGSESKEVVKKYYDSLRRDSELRSYDVYADSRELALLVPDSSLGRISLLKLCKLMHKQGIINLGIDE